MALNNSGQGIIDERRRRVAALLLRGMTQREIHGALGNARVRSQRMLNPRTGKPFSLGTINRDIQALREEWRAEAKRDIDELLGQLLAELREARRLAWSGKDVTNILRGIKQECEMLGIDAPKEIDLLSGGQPIRIKTIEVVKDYGEGGAPGDENASVESAVEESTD